MGCVAAPGAVVAGQRLPDNRVARRWSGARCSTGAMGAGAEITAVWFRGGRARAGGSWLPSPRREPCVPTSKIVGVYVCWRGSGEMSDAVRRRSGRNSPTGSRRTWVAPDHCPGSAVSVCPIWGVPEIVGRDVFDGGSGPGSVDDRGLGLTWRRPRPRCSYPSRRRVPSSRCPRLGQRVRLGGRAGDVRYSRCLTLVAAPPLVGEVDRRRPRPLAGIGGQRLFGHRRCPRSSASEVLPGALGVVTTCGRRGLRRVVGRGVERVDPVRVLRRRRDGRVGVVSRRATYDVELRSVSVDRVAGDADVVGRRGPAQVNAGWVDRGCGSARSAYSAGWVSETGVTVTGFEGGEWLFAASKASTVYVYVVPEITLASWYVVVPPPTCGEH